MDFVHLLLLLLCLGTLSTGSGFGCSTRTRPDPNGASAATTSNPPPWKHHVFISRRGPDGRRNFTDHLDSALRRKLIKVFRDEVDLRRGENITEAISRAIEESMLSIVVLSRGFASSEYCLDELVKIMQCREGKEHHVFPIFYKVSPDDDVSDPTSSGLYKDNLDGHKRMYSYARVNSWIHALQSISQISGWVIADHTPEAEMIEKIAEEILWKVNQMLDNGEEDDDGVVRMGVANGTRSIRRQKAVVDDQEKTMEASSSNHETPQPPGETDVATTSTQKVVLSGPQISAAAQATTGTVLAGDQQITMTIKSFYMANATFVTRKCEPNIQLLGVPVLDYSSNATGPIYVVASVEIVMKLGDNEEELVTTIDVVVLADEEGGGSSEQWRSHLGLREVPCTTLAQKM